MNDLREVTSFHPFFLPSTSLYSKELGKSAQGGPSQPCDFVKLPVKKKSERERERVSEREIVYVSFFSAKFDHKKR